MRESKGSGSPNFDRKARKRMIEEDTGPQGVLVFRLHSAKDLQPADSNGLSDPYVLVRVPGTRTAPWRSRTIRKTLNPTWDEEHDFAGYLADIVSQPLELKVKPQRDADAEPTRPPADAGAHTPMLTECARLTPRRSTTLMCSPSTIRSAPSRCRSST